MKQKFTELGLRPGHYVSDHNLGIKDSNRIRLEGSTSATAELFVMSRLIKDLNHHFLMYTKFGLSSHLNACGTLMAPRNSTVGRVANFKGKSHVIKLKPEGVITWLSLLITETKSLHHGSQDLQQSWDSEATVAYLASTSLMTNKSSQLTYGFSTEPTSSSKPKVDVSEECIEKDRVESYEKQAFKLSRDYTFDEEGFEDWSFLNQERPYDTLVRENIFELLEDLEKTDGTSVKWEVEQSKVITDELKDKAITQQASKAPLSTKQSSLLQEHLLSSEIHKIYANRLRLEQRIKQFYGLVTQRSFQKSLGEAATSSTTTSVWSSLLKLEDRLDIQLFRLKWASSIALARQLLKHKHIGIIKAKDGTQTGSKSKISSPQISMDHTLVKATNTESLTLAQTTSNFVRSTGKLATGNMFLNCGDLLYWRKKTYTNPIGMEKVTFQGHQSGSYHEFPWFTHLNGLGQESSDSLPLVLSLTSSQGSIDVANELMLTNNTSESSTLLPSYLNSLNLVSPTVKGTDLKHQQLCYYHYKHIYCIRSSEIPTKEYLRLPQSSIHKNEWKAFLESSIAV